MPARQMPTVLVSAANEQFNRSDAALSGVVLSCASVFSKRGSAIFVTSGFVLC